MAQRPPAGDGFGAPAGAAASRHALAIFIALALLGAGGCASIPGKTREEQATAIEELEQKTLVDVQKQAPHSTAELDSCVGYVIMNNKLTKIPLVGVGAGYGVALDKITGQRTYLRMRRFDIGAGWGVRGIRPVLIFHDAGKFRRYIKGGFEAKVGAEASAKVGEKGGAGGGGGQAAKDDPGYTSYLITDTGVSATATFAIVRVKQVKLKKK
jgi:hypothetical protein